MKWLMNGAVRKPSRWVSAVRDSVLICCNVAICAAERALGRVKADAWIGVCGDNVYLPTLVEWAVHTITNEVEAVNGR